VEKGITIEEGKLPLDIPLTPLSNHLNGKTRSKKVGSLGV